MDPWSAPEAGFTRRTKVVIVGSGAGGAFAALTLAEAGLEVLVLEAGHPYDYEAIDFATAAMRYYAESGFRTTKGDPPIPVAGCRTVGGSTTMNSALCFRTPERRLEEWNRLSAGAFADTAAFYRAQDEVEGLLGVAPTPDDLLSGNDRTHREAARALGWSERPLRRNTPDCAGCGRCNYGCPDRGKNSVELAVLPRAAAAGARILVGCEVTRVRAGKVEGEVRSATGELRGVFSVEADAVVLAGGAISTPRLLLESEVVDAEGEVGRGLRLQPTVSVLGYFPDREVFAAGAAQGHCITEFEDEDIVMEANPTMGSILGALPVQGEELHTLLGNGHRWASTGVLVRGSTEGRVVASRGGPAKIHYDLADRDRPRLDRALMLGARLWLEGLGADRAVLGLFGRSMFTELDAARRHLELIPTAQLVLYTSHPQSTCGLGRATDDQGQLRELPGVYCLDASSLPSSVGRNPQISIMTVARLLAGRLALSLGGRPRPLDPVEEAEPGDTP